MPLQSTIRHGSGLRRRPIAPRAHVSTVGQCFDIEVSRDASGWVVRVPELDAVTYTRRRTEVAVAARECIAARTGIPIGYIAVVVRD